MSTRIRPIKRSGLADQVVSRVRALIEDRSYRVGERLPPEPDLSSMFGVGRSTVREAMRVLASRGLVDVRHGEGTFVAARTAQETLDERLARALIRDIYEGRLFLELAFAELAAERRSPNDVAAMRRCLKRRAAAARAGDVAGYTESDFAFHLAVAKAARSPALYHVYESFIRTAQGSLEQALTPDYIRGERDRLHAALCGAIARGDASEARRVVRSHLQKSLDELGDRFARSRRRA